MTKQEEIEMAYQVKSAMADDNYPLAQELVTKLYSVLSTNQKEVFAAMDVWKKWHELRIEREADKLMWTSEELEQEALELRGVETEGHFDGSGAQSVIIRNMDLFSEDSTIEDLICE